jgi:DUF2970 family protein
MNVKSPLFAAFLHLLRNHWPRRKVVMETVKTVLFGASGIRSCSGALVAATLNPIYVIIGAILFVVLFILALLTIVHIVTS